MRNTRRADLKRTAQELGLGVDAAHVLPARRLTKARRDRRVVAHLLAHVAVFAVWTRVLECLAQQRIKRLGNAANGRAVV